MILTAVGISMVVPEFVPIDKWHFYSLFMIFAMITLYWVFLRLTLQSSSPNQPRQRLAQSVGAIAFEPPAVSEYHPLGV